MCQSATFKAFFLLFDFFFFFGGGGQSEQNKMRSVILSVTVTKKKTSNNNNHTKILPGDQSECRRMLINQDIYFYAKKYSCAVKLIRLIA